MVELIDPKIFENNLSKSRIKEIRIGNSNSKIIIIDNFFVHPEKVREYALSAKYAKDIFLDFLQILGSFYILVGI
jgi:hypothetical protein